MTNKKEGEKCKHEVTLIDKLSDEDEGIEYCAKCGKGIRDLNYQIN